jgi:uncharacterized protein
MRRKDKEITDKKLIEKILSTSEICRIAMIDDGKPYMVPLNYGYFKNELYFHSALAGKKIELLKLNKHVCFEIEYGAEIIKTEVSCKWSTRYRSIIGYGTIEIIDEFEQKQKALDIIMAQNGKSFNNIYEEKQINNLLILKLQIEEISCKQSGNWD